MLHPHTPTIAVVGAATVVSYALIARHLRTVVQRLDRCEDLGERIAATERDVLTALRRTETGGTAARLLN